MESDNRNIQDKYKGWMQDLIRQDLESQKFPFGVLVEHLQGDFNFGSIIRNANAFGAQQVFYLGKKKWDRRGAVGTHHYINVTYLDSLSEVEKLLSKYTLVGLENGEDLEPHSMFNFEWPTPTLMAVGEEGRGLSEEMLKLCEYKVEIPQFGSVRSLNAATAAGIAMYDLVNKEHLKQMRGFKEVYDLKE